MKMIRTRYFKYTLVAAVSLSVLFLGMLILFGAQIAKSDYHGLLDGVFAVFGLAAVSFLTFSFVPFFKGERRWYSISLVFVLTFFLGAVLLWQATPIPEAVMTL